MVHSKATDPLGSPRVITNKQSEVISRRDFMPFGEEVVADATYRTAAHKYGIGDGVRQKFTGYERDEETGLDFAEARYYYNDHGRFTAVDPLLASGKSANPQTFNRYAYTMNRPFAFIDPLGMAPEIIVTGDYQQDYLKRLQSEMPSVKLGIDPNTNKVVIEGFNSSSTNNSKNPDWNTDAQQEIISSMSGPEAELYTAITDKNVTATISTVKNDSSVFFGRFDGNGQNTVDIGDLDLLDAPSNIGGFSSSQDAAHETLEAYGSAVSGGGFTPAHDYANKFFGGLEDPTLVPNSNRFDRTGTYLEGWAEDYPVHGGGGMNACITISLTPPVKLSDLRSGSIPAGSQLFNIEKVERWPK